MHNLCSVSVFSFTKDIFPRLSTTILPTDRQQIGVDFRLLVSFVGFRARRNLRRGSGPNRVQPEPLSRVPFRPRYAGV